MNKAKLKRIRKDIDKTFQAGRYWEWLKLIENEGLQSYFDQQRAEAWKKLVQRAFRLPKHLMEFFDQVSSFKPLPTFPDFTLLLLLKRQHDGQEVHQELVALNGLSPQGSLFRERALSWEEGLFKKEKIEGILTTLIAQPEKIDKNHYDRLALLTGGPYLGSLIRYLGEGMKKLRKVIGPTSLKKRLNPPLVSALQEADRLLEEIALASPPNFFTILIHPHLIQLAHYLKLKSEKESHLLMGEIITAIPFLFDRLAGEKAQKIRNDLLGASPALLSAKELSHLAKEASQADFEGKVRLLGRVRALVRQNASDDLFALFENLFQDVLAGVSEKASRLDGRQKKELSLLFSPIIKKDLDLLWEREGFYGDLSPLVALMEAVGKTGCLDQKLALLALITAEKGKDRTLKETAHQALSGPGKPGSEDLQWVLEFLDEEIFPRVGLIKPLTDFFLQEPTFLDQILGYLKKRLDFYLVMASSSKPRGLDLSNQAFEESIFAEESQEILTATRNQLSQWKGDPVFSPALAYLQCFQGNVFTVKGYTKHLELIYQGQKSLMPILDHLMEVNHQITLFEKTAAPEILDSSLDFLLTTKQKSLLAFILAHMDTLKEVPLQRIEEILPIIRKKMSTKDQESFLIRLSNLCSDRIKEGEKGAGPLKNHLIDLLARLKRRY
ncbi:MAG: hypothetical protein AB1585_05195 [Thermodesulfobacteriota bacterium]